MQAEEIQGQSNECDDSSGLCDDSVCLKWFWNGLFCIFLQREPTNRQLFLQDIEHDDVPKVITKLLQGFI